MVIGIGNRVKITGGKYQSQGGLVVSIVPIQPRTKPEQQNCRVKLDESDQIVDCLESQF